MLRKNFMDGRVPPLSLINHSKLTPEPGCSATSVANGQHSHNSIRLHEPPVTTVSIATVTFHACILIDGQQTFLCVASQCIWHCPLFGHTCFLADHVYCVPTTPFVALLPVVGHMQHSCTWLMVAMPQPSLDNSTQPCAYLYVQPCTL